MKIVIFVDKEQSAIHRLALDIQKYNPHWEIRIQAVHPKRPDAEQIMNTSALLKWCDLIFVKYWRTGDWIKEHYKKEFFARPRILAHHNPYDLQNKYWLEDYNAVTVSNSSMQSEIPYSYLIEQGIDLGFYEFNSDYTEEKIVNMVVARIEGSKGVREVAQACRNLKYKFVLVGRPSKPDYLKDVSKEGGEYIEFKENISDSELREVYYKSAIHVCNSKDGFESGTMPILESMACGVPVLTRNIGHVPDLYDGKNMVVREGKQEDLTDLEANLKEMMENLEWRKKLRENAWKTVKNRPAEKMARRYSKLFYKVLEPDKKLVSVIVPTKDRHDVLIKSLAKIAVQDYENFEVVVVDSGNKPAEDIVKRFAKETNKNFKYIYFENKNEYTLPKARNLGVIEAEGELLVFCDERIGMKQGAITAFVNTAERGKWSWGIKDGVEKGFVENFSCVYRDDLILRGMFNERIDCYGGATQEIRERFEKIGGMFFQPAKAEAVGLAHSSAGWRKRDEIIKAKYLLWKLYGNE